MGSELGPLGGHRRLGLRMLAAAMESRQWRGSRAHRALQPVAVDRMAGRLCSVSDSKVSYQGP